MGGAVSQVCNAKILTSKCVKCVKCNIRVHEKCYGQVTN